MINKKRYDYALELRGDLRYIYFMHFCNAERKISYNYTGGECFLTDVITPSKDVVHLVEDKLFFLESLGCCFDWKNEVFPYLRLSERQERQKEEFCERNGLQRKVVIGIHPGASVEIKRWQRFANVLAAIYKEVDNAFFIVFEGPNEANVVSSITATAEECEAHYLVSHTDLEEYMTRISACDVMLCNDSGAGHLAVALGVMSYVIFGPVCSEKAKPYSKDWVVCFSEKISCKPCLSQKCENDNYRECLDRIEAEQVSREVIEYLQVIQRKA